MSYARILAIDPSGNFEEGKGTSGWCLYEKTPKGWRIRNAWSISAKNYSSQAEYHDAHLTELNRIIKINPKDIIIIIEDYLLYKSKAQNQIHSRLETPQLIGVLKQALYKLNVPYTLQPASIVKKRWSNKILLHKGILQKNKNNYKCETIEGYVTLNRHCIDAIRHAVHFSTFKNKE